MSTPSNSKPSTTTKQPQPAPKPSSASSADDVTGALSLSWNFGQSSCGGRCSDIINFSSVHQVTETSNADARVFYTAGHTGIIYDSEKHEQIFLKGHINQLSAVGTTKDSNRFLITADRGEQGSAVIVWDTSSIPKSPPTPIKTIFDAHGGRGVLCLDICGDSKYLVTLGDDAPQTICIWEWAQPSASMLKQSYTIKPGSANSRLNTIKFHPEDPYSLVGNGNNHVVFFQWDQKSFNCYNPIANNKELLHEMPEYTVSTFLPLNKVPARDKEEILLPQAISATKTGHVVVWSDRSLDNLMLKLTPKGQMAAIKYARLHSGAINDMRIRDDLYIVTAGSDGFIRVHDFQFKMVAWFDSIKCGPIASFAYRPTSVPDVKSLNGCLIKTEDSRVFKLSDNCPPQLVMRSPGTRARCMSINPKASEFVLGTSDGWLQLWSMDTKRIVGERHMGEPLSCVCYLPNGKHLIVGYSTGRLSVLQATAQFEDILRPSTTILTAKVRVDKYTNFEISKDPITQITCSENSQFIACCDSSGKVAIFSFIPFRPELDCEWHWLGNCRSHYGPVAGLYFGQSPESGGDTCVSVGQDRFMVEYDLVKSSVTAGVQVLKRSQMEQCAVPTAVSGAPQIDPVARFIYVANSEMKVKMVNISSQMACQTTLVPDYGQLIQRMQVLPSEYGTDDYLVFNGAEKLVGMSKLPLDGNPARSMAVIGHPSAILAISCAAKGKYVMSLGDSDGAINCWETKCSLLDAQLQTAPKNIFIRMLPGGESGQFHRDMLDLFYYAQLKSQGEDTLEKRNYGKIVQYEQIPEMMQAIGFYPTEQEIECMLNEIKYQDVVETGKPHTTVTFEDWVRLYVNYRPYEPLVVEDVVKALRDLNVLDGKNEIAMDKLSLALEEFGEVFPPEELQQLLRTLTENHSGLTGAVESGGKISLDDFLSGVLGLLRVPVAPPQEC